MSGPLAYSSRDHTEVVGCIEPGKTVVRKLSQGQSLKISGSNEERKCKMAVHDQELWRQVMEEVSAQRHIWIKTGSSARLKALGKVGCPL